MANTYKADTYVQKKRFSSVYYRTNDITNSTFLYTEHIKPFGRKHTIHKIQNEGMSHDAQTIKSTAKIKKNKSHHMKSSFAAQVPL